MLGVGGHRQNTSHAYFAPKTFLSKNTNFALILHNFNIKYKDIWKNNMCGNDVTSVLTVYTPDQR